MLCVNQLAMRSEQKELLSDLRPARLDPFFGSTTTADDVITTRLTDGAFAAAKRTLIVPFSAGSYSKRFQSR